MICHWPTRRIRNVSQSMASWLTREPFNELLPYSTAFSQHSLTGAAPLKLKLISNLLKRWITKNNTEKNTIE